MKPPRPDDFDDYWYQGRIFGKINVIICINYGSVLCYYWQKCHHVELISYAIYDNIHSGEKKIGQVKNFGLNTKNQALITFC